MKDFVAHLLEKIDISERDLERIVSAFLLTNDFWTAIAVSRLPFNTIVKVSKYLYEEGIISFGEEGKVLLTDKGKALFNHLLLHIGRDICPNCEGRGLNLGEWKELLERYEVTTVGRPEPLLEYDQGYLTAESVIARIAFAYTRGDIMGKKVIVLGDDDLLSIALGLSRLPEEVMVLEIDERIVEFIERASKENKLKIEVRKHDLRYPLTADLLFRFDTFFTDPLETLQGLEVFIDRGISSLKGVGCAGYFGLTTAESSLRKWREIEKILVGKFGVVITDILSDFSLYENWDYLLESIKRDLPPLNQKPNVLWYKSSLFRIELVEGYTSFNEEGKGELYIDEESIAWSMREEKC